MMPTIPWQWNDADAGGYAEAQNRHFRLTRNDDGRAAEIRCTDAAGKIRWAVAIDAATTDSAALTVYEDKLFAALYWHGATGCRVLALDVDTGEQHWATTLSGLGSIGHSRYINRVQITVSDDRLLVFGNESAGKYIEVLDPSSGRRIHIQKVSD